MTNLPLFIGYRTRIEQELRHNILPFWIERVARPGETGFLGSLTNDLQVDDRTERGALLTTRILWTYAAADHAYGDREYRAMADRAYDDLESHFADSKHGGYIWAIGPDGSPQGDRKQVYGQAFAIYALSEYHRATGLKRPLQQAIATYRLLEEHARDREAGGYGEAYGRTWAQIADVRLSAVDLNSPKSQNTMLHVMEAYTNLLAVWPDPELRQSLHDLVEVMLSRIINPQTHHLGLFFSRDWALESDRISFGHDIEAAWLLCAAAEQIGNPALLARVRAEAMQIAAVTRSEGMDGDGGLFNEGSPQGISNTNKEWWPQAEAVVGFLNATEISGDLSYLDTTLRSWDFIEAHIIDHQHGEWFRGVTRDHQVLTGEMKVSFWKCPYHNGRACLEAVRRLDRIIGRIRRGKYFSYMKDSSASKSASPQWKARLRKITGAHRKLLARKNPIDREWDNGVFERFVHPVLTYQHAPIEWRYDLNPATNPFLMERLGVNATLNPGAFFWKGKVHLVVRFEGYDRKSIFAIAESPNGIDQWRFWDEPVDLSEIKPETNVYDMRITFHQDGWIYGVFCSEAKDPQAKPGDLSSAVAVAGVVRTRDFKRWERLPNLKTPASQQRNVVLHPEWVNRKYAFYTRPMDGFIDVGSGGGIGWTLCKDITSGVTGPETIIDSRAYHTIKEVKNGQGPAPIKTTQGWLHLAHGVRNCAAGLRYVLYMFMTSLDDPSRVIARPGGYFLAPYGEEGFGDVSNVTFSNGWVQLPGKEKTVLIYYGGSDTRCYVARSSLDRLVDWCLHTPEEAPTTRKSLDQRLRLIRANRSILQRR